MSFDATAAAPAAQGYGKDPNLMKVYASGDLWPLTLTKEQRATATALCDLIIPADGDRPPHRASAWSTSSTSGSARRTRSMRSIGRPLLDGLSWIDGEAQRRFGTTFAKLSATQMAAIADAAGCRSAFFMRYRALTAGGFYTTPVGMRDLKYVGNVAMTTFDGPTQDVLKKLGLA